MRAYEFLNEDPGFNAQGPSGTRFARGFDLSAAYGGMYRAGTRFSDDDLIHEPQFDPENIPNITHYKKILSRIAGGMDEKQSINAYAKEIGMDINAMSNIFDEQKSKHNLK